jgi:TorA maturation chaperone TorD
VVEAKAFHAPSAAESEQVAARERGYGFLAWLFLAAPDIPFLERMLDADVGSYVASLAAGGGAHPMIITGLEEMRGWLAAQAHLPLEQVRQELAVQETWLFKGIAPGYGPPPPYEAVYRRSGAGVDAATLLSLRSFYREAEADLPPNSRERLDHLGLELDFMRFLCGEESRLWCSNDAGEAVRYRRMQRRFLAEHLTPWVPGYCQRLLGEPCAPFFHGLARALSGFLAEDAMLLDRWAEEEGGPGHPDPAPIR